MIRRWAVAPLLLLAATDLLLVAFAVPTGIDVHEQLTLIAADGKDDKRREIDAEDEANGAKCGNKDFASHSRDAKQWGADHGWDTNCVAPCTLVGPVESACPIDTTIAMDQGDASELVLKAEEAYHDRGAHATQGQWTGKFLRIRAPIRDGFWVRALFVIQQATWAAYHNIPFFVDLNVNGAACGDAAACKYDVAQPVDKCTSRGVCDAYYDPTEAHTNSWEQYFLPIMGHPAAEVYANIHESDIIELDWIAGWFQDILQMPVYAESSAKAAKQRLHRSKTVAAWVQPNAEMSAEANRQWSANVLRGASPTSPVLGVHMRGTDKYIGAGKIGPEQYFPLIDAYLAANEGPGKPNVTIYLATDDTGYHDATVAKYGKRVGQQANVDRATGDNAVWKAASSAGAHKRGMQVMLDSLLLSKCSYILKSNSAVSEFAIYFNPKLIENSYDFGLPDRKSPSWAPGLTVATPSHS